MEEDKSIAELSKDVSDQFDADLFVFSGSVDNDSYGKLTAAVAAAKHSGSNNPAALLILTTNGGQANSAFQIARLFQNSYDFFVVCTPSYCKSAGTLIALGANILIMDTFSELGPLDVQLVKENEIAARKSGLLSRSALESLQESAFELFEHFMLRITLSSGGNVSFRIASEISAQMVSGLLSGVYSQINPEIVGSEFRDLNVALQYGFRLIEHSRNADFDTVHRLVHGYPSHDFIIDHDEVNELFERVLEPTNELYRLLGALSDNVYQEAIPNYVLYLEPHTNNVDEESETSSDADEQTIGEEDGQDAVKENKRTGVDKGGKRNRRRNRGKASSNGTSSSNSGSKAKSGPKS